MSYTYSDINITPENYAKIKQLLAQDMSGGAPNTMLASLNTWLSSLDEAQQRAVEHIVAEERRKKTQEIQNTREYQQANPPNQPNSTVDNSPTKELFDRIQSADPMTIMIVCGLGLAMLIGSNRLNGGMPPFVGGQMVQPNVAQPGVVHRELILERRN
jgi:hypothetical protein